ncbi:MAG: HD domain-containing protein [Acidimicrobiales bacterium]
MDNDDHLPRWAVDLSSDALAIALPDRLTHCLAVGATARRTARMVCRAIEEELLAAAGVLHDIGYAPHLVQTGHHAIDGARYLARVGVADAVVSLVAHHSCAAIEAQMRLLGDQLGEFDPPSDSFVADVLTFADMTTGPTGLAVSTAERFEDIIRRHGAGSLTGQFLEQAQGTLEESVGRVEVRLRVARTRVA